MISSDEARALSKNCIEEAPIKVSGAIKKAANEGKTMLAIPHSDMTASVKKLLDDNGYAMEPCFGGCFVRWDVPIQ